MTNNDNESMLIYDFGNQNTIDFNQIIIGLFFLVLGLIIFFVFSKYKPEVKEDFFTQLLGVSRGDLEEHSNMTPKVFKLFGLLAIFASLLIFIIQFKNYYYVKNIDHVENVLTMTSKIDSIKTEDLLGSNYITINIKDKEFCILKDRKYMSLRNLMIGDSIKIKYFVNESAKLNHYEVIKIELMKNGA